MTPDDIRNSFLNHMQDFGSKIIPPANILPENDPSTLFVGSGMQPMVPYLLGQPHPMGTDLANVQPCVRTGDIEEVGDQTHLTYFEMTGRWELGSDVNTYKTAQIACIMDWKLNTLGLDPNRFYVSVYQGNKELGIDFDSETIEIWKTIFARYGIEATVELEPLKYGASRGGRIFAYDDSENWWSRSGPPDKMPVGEPGGPDSEMFYDFNPDGDSLAHPANGGDRFVEIGNNVFMSHKREESGFVAMSEPNIDYGGGLERIYAAATGERDMFRTPFFAGALARLEALTGLTYEENKVYFRIVLDHVRAATFLIASGALPSNRDAGYVVRRLIRRSARVGRKMGLDAAFQTELSEIYVLEATAYAFIAENRSKVIEALSAEEGAFLKTLILGENEIRRFMKKSDVRGEDAFKFYETYGYPLELTKEVLADEGKELMDEDGYYVAEKAHSQLSKSASGAKFKGGLADHSEMTTVYHTTTHLLLAALQKVLGTHVHQMGSNITAERMRFDFSHPSKVDADELKLVEEEVNAAIASDAKVSILNMSKQKAYDDGIEGSFWEKYPENVTVYEIKSSGGDILSLELCGGPHVEDMSEVRAKGRFQIKKEQSASAGVRRIRAVLVGVGAQT